MRTTILSLPYRLVGRYMTVAMPLLFCAGTIALGRLGYPVNLP